MIKNRVIILVLIIVLLFSAAIYAEEEDGSDSGTVIAWDLGFGFSMGFFDKDSGDYNQADGIMKTALSFRGGVHTAIRYHFLSLMSIGVDTGVFYMTANYGDNISETFIDIPVRALFRIGFENSYLEPHAGYYIANGSNLGGVDLGIKLSIKSFYFEYSYIVGTENYSRIVLGYTWNNLLTF